MTAVKTIMTKDSPGSMSKLIRLLYPICPEAKGPAVVTLPLRGISALDAPGSPFFDPAADAALFEAIESGLKGSTNVRVIKLDLHINDPEFADAAVAELIKMM